MLDEAVARDGRASSLRPVTRRLALLLTLLVAACLRFTGLTSGLLHTPVRDEQDFVESAGEMIAHGDWDNRFYEYPGFFFDVLKVLLPFAPKSPPYHSTWDGLPRTTHFGPSGYLAARAIVASAGVASVLMVVLLGGVLIGEKGGLAAGLLLAVSPVEVFVSHEVRPDVVLEVLVLLALLVFARKEPRPRDDVLSGIVLGLAAATKLTGFLLVPAYVLARILAGERRFRGAALGLASATALWLVVTPYAAVNAHRFLGGVAFQVNWHYRGAGVAARFGEALFFYLGTLLWSLGPLGALLAVFGLVLTLMERRRAWAPALVYALTLILTLSTASMFWHRLVLSTLGISALLAGAGFEALLRRSRPVSLALALVAALFPLSWSIDYLRSIVAPSSRDLALRTLEEHFPKGGRFLNSLGELSPDRSRFELVPPTGSQALDRLVARESAGVVWNSPDREAVSGLNLLFRGEPSIGGGALGARPELSLKSMALPVYVFETPEELHPRWDDVPLEGAQVTASREGESARRAVDGRMATRWSTMRNQRHGDLFEVVLPEAVLLGRVELLLGRAPWEYARALGVYLSGDGREWNRVPSADLRPRVEDQIDAEQGKGSQLVVFQPVRARGVRLRLLKDADQPWSLAEVKLKALHQDGPS